MKMTRRAGLGLVLAMATGLFGAAQALAADPLKVGFVSYNFV